MELADHLRFDEKGLIPAVIFNAEDNRILVLCYMDKEALRQTISTGMVHVFRRSKKRVMLKGEISGHVQKVKDILVDCEGNSVAFAIEQKVAACAHGYFTCYYRRYDRKAHTLDVIHKKVFDPGKVYDRG